MKNNQNFTWRFDIFTVGALLFLLLMIVKMVQIQIGVGGLEVTENRFQAQHKLPPERGKIFDRNLKTLAFNIPTVTLFADPKKIENANAAARAVASLTGLDYAQIREKLGQKSNYVKLAMKLPLAVHEQLGKLGITGLYSEVVLTRKYPKNDLCSQLLGFTDIDGKGISGLEMTQDFLLQGAPGRVVYQITANNEKFPRIGYPEEQARDGNDFVLTIDYRYQYIAERELHNTILQTDAAGGAVIIMNPESGEILAMCSEPNFNPNEPGKAEQEAWRIKPVTDIFEPGSTFKPVLMSALLEKGLHTTTDIVFCENGKYMLKDRPIRDTAPYAWLSLRDVMVYSSNIGMSKLAMETDRKLLYDYARAFGFGQESGVGLQGEQKGILSGIGAWSGVSPGFISIGHEVAVTALQMTNMFSTIANGGFLMQPVIVKEIRKDGIPVKVYGPRAIRRVISTVTADTMKSILADVVERGTGKKAAIKGVTVCGKTGTAKMPFTDRKNVGYQEGNYISNFCGFFPAENPKICIYVMIEKPRNLYYGGDVGAPCFKNIAEQLITFEGLDYFQSPDVQEEFRTVENNPAIVPNLVGCSRAAARYAEHKSRLPLHTGGDGQFILAQNPPAGTVLAETQGIRLDSETSSDDNDAQLVPNVTGLPVRNAMNILAVKGFRAVIIGSGKVARQQPGPGKKIGKQEQVLLQCESAVNLNDLLVLR